MGSGIDEEIIKHTDKLVELFKEEILQFHELMIKVTRKYKETYCKICEKECEEFYKNCRAISDFLKSYYLYMIKEKKYEAINIIVALLGGVKIPIMALLSKFQEKLEKLKHEPTYII